MLLSILSVFFASALAAFLYKSWEKLTAIVISCILIANITYFTTYFRHIIQGKTISSSFEWIDSLGIKLSFYLDGLSLFFVLLITVFGLLIFGYSYQYMQHSSQRGRFFSYFFLFMGSMLGLVLSANTIGLFVFWELTSFSSFLLIGYNHHKAESRRAARQALLVTAGGGLALMTGFILLEISTKTGFNLIESLNQTQAFQYSSLQNAVVLLIAIGAFSKSAQFPLHFWLPNAMAAPTPVSAYLHSSTMVKAGVYLIFRMNPLFGEFAVWSNTLAIVGAVTMTWGAFKSFHEDDLKKILAYTTISALGVFFMMTGIGSEEAINATMVYVLAHALYKGGLFLTAGSIDHQTGTRSLAQLSDLTKKMPFTATTVLLSCASMAGLIPFLGFVGKESLYASLYHDQQFWYLGMLFLASGFFTAMCIEIVYSALIKKGEFHKKNIRETHLLMVLAPLVLAVTGLFTGIAPHLGVEPLLRLSAANASNFEPSMHLKLWHGFNMVFVLSIVTLLFGGVLYFFRKPLRKYSQIPWIKADWMYDQVMEGISSFSRFSTKTIQNGYLRNYVAMVLVTFSGLVIWVLFDGQIIHAIWPENVWKDIQIYEVVILALIGITVIFLFKTTSRLIVSATFGIIGYSIALAYTLFSAPDVAITQFLAETLTLMLLILILHRLPSYTLKKPIAHMKYLPISIVFGMVMAVTSFILLNLKPNSRLKSFFLENSISQGKGQNAVNVILVDFRALDTLGEITVLTVTMVGIIALLKLKPDTSEL